MEKEPELEQLLSEFVTLLESYVNSDFMPQNTDIDDDITSFIIKPLKRLEDYSVKDVLSKNDKEEIAKSLNGVWYSYNQRSDMRTLIGEHFIRLDDSVKRKIFNYFNYPLNKHVDFALISDIAGKLGLKFSE